MNAHPTPTEKEIGALTFMCAERLHRSGDTAFATGAAGMTAPRSSASYLIGKRRYLDTTPEFHEALREAHGSRIRPRCLCRPEGIEMYVARQDFGFVIKRMPDSGQFHASDCHSYEPPASWSSLDSLMNHAIREDPRSGETMLNVAFTMSHRPPRTPSKDASCESTPAPHPQCVKLTLLGLLQYLWHQAELTHWQPSFSGRRTWATVRRLLLHAAANKRIQSRELTTHLFIPESFSVEQRGAIDSKRLAQWSGFISTQKTRPLMLLIAELKALQRARFGYLAVVKHMPDQAFTLQEELYRRIERRFEAELELWTSAPDLRLILIATYWLSATGIPKLETAALMPVTPQWLPIDDRADLHLIRALLLEDRAFIKIQRYGLPTTSRTPCAVLTDTADAPVRLFIDRSTHSTNTSTTGEKEANMSAPETNWSWQLHAGEMPELPTARFNAPYEQVHSSHCQPLEAHTPAAQERCP
ncbi:MAG: hypothetical protein CFE43_09430 [Burkholderiales bacterium PBB3]|nr:MAG: hypothetical protein CFE43_09430 [Burkholderiales bacterium PBB3]